VSVVMSYHAKHLISLLPEDPASVALLGTEKPPNVTAGGSGTYQAELYGGSSVGRQVVKSYMSATIVTGGRTGTGHSRV
jgi:hypothetical protein